MPDLMPIVIYVEPIYVTKIRCFGYQTYFLKNNGEVWNCGFNQYGELGRVIADGSTSVVNLGQLVISDVKEIVCGSNFTYFLKTNGEVWNCGLNDNGSLGRVVNTGSQSVVNLDQLTISDVKEIILINDMVVLGLAGSAYFLKNNGEVWNCGNNGVGQLGRVVNTGSQSVVNLDQLSMSDVKEITGGGNFTYFLKNNGEVWNCGQNGNGELGRVVSNGSPSVVNLGQLAISDVKKIVGGSGFTYFLKNNGEVWNCGANNYGQLGRVVNTGSTSVVNLGQLSISDVKEIVCGGNFTYFLKNNGEVWNCGNNGVGQLGRVVNTGSQSVVNLDQLSISDVKEIVCGGNFTYFLKNNGEVWNCGYNFYGSLGRVVSNGSPSVVNLGQLDI